MYRVAGGVMRGACHAGEGPASWWSADPWMWVPLALLCVLYARGVLVLGGRSLSVRGMPWFALGAAALFLALVWPFDVLAARSFAAHMAQHMLLIGVAAPLLVLARPSAVLLAAIPYAGRRALGPLFPFTRPALRPGVAFSLHAGAIWLGHAPRVIDWALESGAAHFFDHALLFGTALLFWRSLLRGGRSGHGVAALWTLATMLHTGALGALLTFAPKLLYRGYSLEDQQLAGLIMWIPGGTLYLAASLGFAATWLRGSEPASPQSRARRT